MSPKPALLTIALHAILLVLASTQFTVLSWMWGDCAWSWNYFQYSHRNGWGFQYLSDYSLAVVLTYIVAYLAGFVGFVMARNIRPTGWAVIGIILSVLGLVSFLIEGSHWLWSHHLSWIVSCPAGCLILAGVVMVQISRKGGNWAHVPI